MNVTRFHFNGGNSDHIAISIAYQIHGQPLYKETGFGLNVLLVERVQHGVARAIGGCASAFNGFFAVVGGVTSKRALVNRAVRVAIERHAHVLKVVNHLGRFTAHELNRVLVAEPVGTFNGVIKMVMPIVFVHVSQ